jgi:nicotinamidase-related amidase
VLARSEDSVVLVVDLQEKFLAPIFEAERVLKRAEFLLKVAAMVGIPAFATEQNPERMGGTHASIAALIDGGPVQGKMRFSCFGCEGLEGWLAQQRRRQVILVGVETHICVNQTAHNLVDLGYAPILAEDAISARTQGMHRNGIERMRAYGVTVAHTESVAYEWLGGADHPRFREMLQIVKQG